MPRICIIFYQHIVRELRMCRRLAGIVEEKGGGDVRAVVLSVDFEWMKALDLARREDVAMLVVPWMRLGFHDQIIAPFAAANPDLTVLNLNHEQIGTAYSMPVLLPSAPFAIEKVQHCAWGDFFARELRRRGVPEDAIHVTGNARLDEIARTTRARADLADAYGLDGGKLWVLFAESRFEGYGVPGSGFRAEVVQCGVAEGDVDEYSGLTSDSLRRFLGQLGEVDDGFFERFEFIYRLHPGQNLERPIDGRVRVISELPISEWLGAVDAYMTYGSTSALEADIAGVPVTVCWPEDIPGKYRLECLERYQRIRHPSEIAGLDLGEIAARQAESRSYERYFGAVDGRSADRIADVVLGLLADRRQFAWGLDVDPSFIRRKRLYEAATRVVCATGLIDIVKYPKSAYKERRDIPYLNGQSEI